MIEFEANLFEFKMSLNTNLNTSCEVIEKTNMISNPNRGCAQLVSLKKLKSDVISKSRAKHFM